MAYQIKKSGSFVFGLAALFFCRSIHGILPTCFCYAENIQIIVSLVSPPKLFTAKLQDFVCFFWDQKIVCKQFTLSKYVPGTQMTPVLIGKCLLLEGFSVFSPPKKEDKQVPGICTMSPQNHEKYRFWPPKNQVIYHKNLKKCRFGGPMVYTFWTSCSFLAAFPPGGKPSRRNGSTFKAPVMSPFFHYFNLPFHQRIRINCFFFYTFFGWKFMLG